MSRQAEQILDEAIAWHLGVEEAGTAEWRDFVAWLEADPAHAEAYDRLTLEQEALAEVPAPIVRAPPAVHRRSIWPRRAAWGGGALAAMAAAWLALMPIVATTSDPYSIETRPGMRHVVVLPDGTKISMNGDTRITLDRGQPRYAALDRGQATFDVVHHADHPFEVRAGGVLLRDVGTRFDVVRRAGGLDVAVAEGSVLYQPDAEAVPLKRGMALAMRDGDDRVTLSRVEPAHVGGWTGGRLDFRDVPLAIVAEDVGRSTGARLRVDPSIAGRKFTGTLRVDRAPRQVARGLAQLADAGVRGDGPGWLIAPK